MQPPAFIMPLKLKRLQGRQTDVMLAQTDREVGRREDGNGRHGAPAAKSESSRVPTIRIWKSKTQSANLRSIAAQANPSTRKFVAFKTRQFFTILLSNNKVLK